MSDRKRAKRCGAALTVLQLILTQPILSVKAIEEQQQNYGSKQPCLPKNGLAMHYKAKDFKQGQRLT